MIVDGRVLCCVPGCHRTTGVDVYTKRFGHPPGEWICSTHWGRVPRAMRRAKARHERERRRLGFFPREEAYRRVWGRIWREITRSVAN